MVSQDSETPADPVRQRQRRRALLAFAATGAGAAVAAGMLAGLAVAFVQLSWPHQETPGEPEVGINFECNQAEYLLLEDPAKGPAGYVTDDRPGRAEWCAETLGTLLEETGTKHVRLSMEWPEVEPHEGAYDFRLLDALLSEAERHGAGVLLSIGLKGQRHPEFYLPAWVLDRANLEDGQDVATDPAVHDAGLRMVADVARHAAESTAVEAWLADNEPYLPSPRAHNWVIGRTFVQEEVAAIRAADPRGRPVAINHGEHFVFDRRWEWSLEDADIVATSVYPFRNYQVAGLHFVVPILEIGPLAPNYAARARETKERGKEFWITEMQAEPWADGDIRQVSPGEPADDLTPENFRKNMEYARLSGASRVYLWGAEWWLYQQQHYGDGQWLALAREAIAGSGGTAGIAAARR